MIAIFNMVKAAVSVPDAAAHYGLTVTNRQMIRCFFHHDRDHSMKLYDDHFFCFACHSCGDVITFTAEMFGLSPLQAAEKLIADFSILPPPEGCAGAVIPNHCNSMELLFSDSKKELMLYGKNECDAA